MSSLERDLHPLRAKDHRDEVRRVPWQQQRLLLLRRAVREQEDDHQPGQVLGILSGKKKIRSIKLYRNE